MSYQRLCLIEDLELNRGKEFLVADKIVAAFRTDEGVFAVDGMCAHQGGPVAQGELQGKCVTCPWHGWQYDISTGVNLLSQKKMLANYPIEIRAGEVWIDVA
jgi:nitrite reductase (NADH) small subunit